MIENYYSDASKKRREAYLDRILQHAADTTPFYRECKSFTSISDFPVINKNIIRSNSDAFLSTDFNGVKLNKVVTSGSTGTPFTVYQDAGKSARHSADNIYFLEKAGFALGNRLYYLRVWNSLNKKSRLKCFLENVAMEEISELSESQTIGLIERLEKDHSEKALLAYASTYEALLANLISLNKTNLNINLKVIISMSESLPYPVKKQLMQIFKCPVLSRYSNMENGFLAHEVCGQEEYQINFASYYIELLDFEKDCPVKEGEKGRVVVTDLFNRAMPLIRYDTGDVGIMSENVNGLEIKGPAFNKIEGRITDFIYNTDGTLISPHAITNLMWKYSEVKQFQFIQTDRKSYLLKLNSEKKLIRENELINEFKIYLGVNAEMAIEYVEEIPQLASGKRKKIVNAYSGLGKLKCMPKV